MGLFDFVKDAGEALTDKVTGGDSVDELTKTVEVSSERVDQLRGENISRKIASLDIDGAAVDVNVKGSVAVLTGSTSSQEALEKIVLCAGNQFGIEQVDCQLRIDAPENESGADSVAAVPDSQPQATFYTVKSGDTLGKIAQEHYGSAGKYMDIFEANQPMLEDPDKIYPGQQLRIPQQ